MSEKIQDLVHDLLDGIHGIAKSETVVGDPQAAGEAMIIPIHKLRIAFGVGSAKADAKGRELGGATGGMAAGGAVELDPIAAIAVAKDGTPRILTVEGQTEGTWSALLHEVPDLLVRVVRVLGDKIGSDVKERILAAKPELAVEEKALVEGDADKR